MLTLKLPDGTNKQFPPKTTPRQVAESIGKRLAQAAIAAKFDGEIVDLDRELPPADAASGLAPELAPESAGAKPQAAPEHSFQVLTEKDADALEVLRHSCAHVMARAVMRLFPGAQLAFGPPVENGFYYDIDVEPPIKEEDFPRIEAEMKKIVDKAEAFERFERPVSEARALCNDLAQAYKVEHIDDDLKQYPILSFYRQGEFIDLCRGPHLPHAGKIGAFKVLSIAGAYWKKDTTRKQLQRLYATAFFTQKDLDAYLQKIEEAKKRDHRVLGKQLKLFTISPLVGSGLILWQPRGAVVRGLLETFIKDELIKRGYQPVYTPHIGRLELYRTSGHFPYYRDAQFPPIYMRPAAGVLDLIQWRLSKGELDETEEAKTSEYLSAAALRLPGYKEAGPREKLEIVHRAAKEVLSMLGAELPQYDKAVTAEERSNVLLSWLRDQEGFLLKPMNCPHHIQIYKAEQRSYRDLPIRLAEFGTVYRFEQTGELNGMTRVRGFTQDDAHLFIRPDQIEVEMKANIELVLFVLSSFGLSDYRVRIGTRDPHSDKYVGRVEDWDAAEKALIGVVKNLGMNYTVEPGEAAFYGPKIDFVVRDCIGREWQLGTVQLDFNLPQRFELEYIGADNTAHRPVMIHRAPFGSMERFMGILIEHFAGAFPLWLAFEQCRVLTVSDKFTEYGQKVEKELKASGFRAAGDYRPEKIGFKIREAQLDKIPYMLVVGDKEQTAGTVSVRTRAGGDQGAVPVAQLIERLQTEVREKAL